MADSKSGRVHDLPMRDMDGKTLTVRQRKVLEVIRTSIAERGYPPSMREIGDAVGLSSPSSVSHQLVALERKGYLRRDPPSTRPGPAMPGPRLPTYLLSAGSPPVSR